MGFSSAGYGTYLIVAVVIVVVIGRQLLPGPINERRLLLLPLAATVYGLYLMSKTPHPGLLDLALLAVNLGLGAVLGVGRGATVKVWRGADGVLMSQGTLLTLGLWLVSFAIRIGFGVLSHGAMNTADLALFVGVTFGAQSAVLWMRMQAVGATREPARTLT